MNVSSNFQFTWYKAFLDFYGTQKEIHRKGLRNNKLVIFILIYCRSYWSLMSQHGIIEYNHSQFARNVAKAFALKFYESIWLLYKELYCVLFNPWFSFAFKTKCSNFTWIRWYFEIFYSFLNTKNMLKKMTDKVNTV